jgi:hypothetical protein
MAIELSDDDVSGKPDVSNALGIVKTLEGSRLSKFNDNGLFKIPVNLYK